MATPAPPWLVLPALALAAVGARAEPWKKAFPGFAATAEGRNASDADRQRLCDAPGNHADECPPGRVYSARVGDRTIVASLADGVAIFDAAGSLVARGEPFECQGSQAVLTALAIGQVVADAEPEIVVRHAGGGRQSSFDRLTVLKQRGMSIAIVADVTLASTDGAATTKGSVRVAGPNRLEVKAIGDARARVLVWDDDALTFQGVPAPAAAAAPPAPVPAGGYPPINRPLAVTSVVATSTHADRKDAYAAWRVLAPTVKATQDGASEYDSAWCEGKPDEGVGEGLTITFAEPTRIDGVYVAAGVWKSDKLYASSNRITGLVLTTDDGRRVTVAPPAGRGNTADFTLGGAPVGSITLTIGAAQKGKINDSCISEVQLVVGGKLYSPIVGVDRGSLAALPATAKTINDALSRCDEATLAAHVDLPVRVTSTRHRPDGQRDDEMATRTVGTAKEVCDLKLAVPGIDGEWFAESDAPGRVSFAIYHYPEQRWRLAWRDGRWHLVAFEY